MSETTARRFKELYRPHGAVHVVPHGVDHAAFAPEEPAPGSDAAVLGRLGVAEPYVLHLGTVEPRKNVPALVAAFDAVADGHRRLSLCSPGRRAGGPASWRARSRPRRHRDRVVRLGYVDGAAVPALLRRSAAVAYPSFYEGFGLPALEALACGTPLVTSGGTVMAELAGSAALTVDPADPASLVAALETVLTGGPGADVRRAEGLSRARGLHLGTLGRRPRGGVSGGSRRKMRRVRND